MSIHLLGIDVGTGGTRALLINESGAVVASAIHEHIPFASPRSGWAEQDPHDWWTACQGAVRKLLRDAEAAGLFRRDEASSTIAFQEVLRDAMVRYHVVVMMGFGHAACMALRAAGEMD